MESESETTSMGSNMTGDCFPIFTDDTDCVSPGYGMQHANDCLGGGAGLQEVIIGIRKGLAVVSMLCR